MRKMMLVLLAVVMMAGNAFAASLILSEHYGIFKELIQAYGYVCNTCEGGHALGQGSRGTNFKVYCNDNQNVYFVSWNMSGKQACVEPWARKGTKCEE